jgi:hypothetical protein
MQLLCSTSIYLVEPPTSDLMSWENVPQKGCINQLPPRIHKHFMLYLPPIRCCSTAHLCMSQHCSCPFSAICLSPAHPLVFPQPPSPLLLLPGTISSLSKHASVHCFPDHLPHLTVFGSPSLNRLPNRLQAADKLFSRDSRARSATRAPAERANSVLAIN